MVKTTVHHEVKRRNRTDPLAFELGELLLLGRGQHLLN
jgi:hypothetical protein